MKKLLLLGISELSNNIYDLDLENYEIWTVAATLMNEDDEFNEKIDKFFEIHRKDEYIQDTASYIYKTNKPVFMKEKDEQVKDCHIFPYEDIFNKFGHYFTNSFSLMLCYGVLEGFKEIAIYGIDFLTNREATIERCNFEYWVGYFRGKDIKINVSKNSVLLKSNFVYGIDNILLAIDKSKKRIKRLKKSYMQYYRLLTTYSQKYKAEKNKKKKNELILKYIEYENMMSKFEGAIEEEEYNLRTL